MEEAAAYVFNPVGRDAKRGLKKSWKSGSTSQDGGPEASGTKEPPSSSKGNENYIIKFMYASSAV